MSSTSIIVDQPLQLVWDFFIISQNWRKWWPSTLEKVDPEWGTGATLVWGNGDRSKLRTVLPQQAFTIESQFVSTTYEFVPKGKEQTLIGVSFEARGGASFSDGGKAHKLNLDAALAKAKQCLENE